MSVCSILISFMPGWNFKSFNPVARSYWLAHMGVQFVPSWNAQLRCYCFLRHSSWPLRGYSRFVLKEYCKSLGLLGRDMPQTLQSKVAVPLTKPAATQNYPIGSIKQTGPAPFVAAASEFCSFCSSMRRQWLYPRRNQNSRNIRPFFECQLVLYIMNFWKRKNGHAQKHVF